VIASECEKQVPLDHFTNLDELNAWLNARGWNSVDKERFDKGSFYEWKNSKESTYLKLTENIFDRQNRLKIYTEDIWNDEWLQIVDLPTKTQVPEDDLPF
jgi:hypothetical protein